jgi:hypothetical protein
MLSLGGLKEEEEEEEDMDRCGPCAFTVTSLVTSTLGH